MDSTQWCIKEKRRRDLFSTSGPSGDYYEEIGTVFISSFENANERIGVIMAHNANSDRSYSLERYIEKPLTSN